MTRESPPRLQRKPNAFPINLPTESVHRKPPFYVQKRDAGRLVWRGLATENTEGTEDRREADPKLSTRRFRIGLTLFL